MHRGHLQASLPPKGLPVASRCRMGGTWSGWRPLELGTAGMGRRREQSEPCLFLLQPVGQMSSAEHEPRKQHPPAQGTGPRAAVPQVPSPTCWGPHGLARLSAFLPHATGLAPALPPRCAPQWDRLISEHHPWCQAQCPVCARAGSLNAPGLSCPWVRFCIIFGFARITWSKSRAPSRVRGWSPPAP